MTLDNKQCNKLAKLIDELEESSLEVAANLTRVVEKFSEIEKDIDELKRLFESIE